jgi:hypothetical protein
LLITYLGFHGVPIVNQRPQLLPLLGRRDQQVVHLHIYDTFDQLAHAVMSGTELLNHSVGCVVKIVVVEHGENVM